MENLSLTSLKKALEAVLFMAKEPLDVWQLKDILECDSDQIEQTLKELKLEYAERGLDIVNVAGGYQLATKPEVSKYVAKFLKPAVEVHLTTPALETLAIIAYRQPISRAQIEHIRGVDCDSVLKTLFEKKLIKVVGRADLPGRPILFGTTPEFLFHFGLASLEDLPKANIAEPERKLSDFSLIYLNKAGGETKNASDSNEQRDNQFVKVPIN